jgi:early secretory antigenic target protein ESAT-6
MAGDYVRAVFGSLSDGESQFVAAYNSLSSTVTDLDGQLRSSLATWDGQAQEAYYQAKAVWDKAIADMGAVIQGLSSVLGSANANYQTAERTNSAMFGL